MGVWVVEMMMIVLDMMYFVGNLDLLLWCGGLVFGGWWFDVVVDGMGLGYDLVYGVVEFVLEVVCLDWVVLREGWCGWYEEGLLCCGGLFDEVGMLVGCEGFVVG